MHQTEDILLYVETGAYVRHTSALNSSCPMLTSSGTFNVTSNLGKTGGKNAVVNNLSLKPNH